MDRKALRCHMENLGLWMSTDIDAIFRMIAYVKNDIELLRDDIHSDVHPKLISRLITLHNQMGDLMLMSTMHHLLSLDDMEYVNTYFTFLGKRWTPFPLVANLYVVLEQTCPQYKPINRQSR